MMSFCGSAVDAPVYEGLVSGRCRHGPSSALLHVILAWPQLPNPVLPVGGSSLRLGTRRI